MDPFGVRRSFSDDPFEFCHEMKFKSIHKTTTTAAIRKWSRTQCRVAGLRAAFHIEMNDVVINKVCHKLRLNEITVCIYGPGPRKMQKLININEHQTNQSTNTTKKRKL